MKTWIIYLTKDGKWHSFQECWVVSPLMDRAARRTAMDLTGHTPGTASYIGSATAAYCIHASSRSRAISMARKAYKAKLLC